MKLKLPYHHANRVGGKHIHTGAAAKSFYRDMRGKPDERLREGPKMLFSGEAASCTADENNPSEVTAMGELRRTLIRVWGKMETIAGIPKIGSSRNRCQKLKPLWREGRGHPKKKKKPCDLLRKRKSERRNGGARYFGFFF